MQRAYIYGLRAHQISQSSVQLQVYTLPEYRITCLCRFIS